MMVVAILSIATPSFAQQKASLMGRVVSADSKQAIAYALVHFPESGLQAITNSEGDFIIKQIAAGKHVMHISFLGYDNLDQSIEL